MNLLSSNLNRGLGAAAIATALALSAAAAVPAPEKLLPEDTLVVLTAPNFVKLREVFKNSPQRQFLDDPAMKPFRDKFIAKWKEDFVKPLERELGVRLDDYTALLQGQLTLAVTQNGWQGKPEQNPGFLLLLDAGEKSGQLKTNLANLRKKWVDSGRKIRTEKIRDVEFAIVPLTSNDLPKTLQQFFPPDPPVQELGSENAPKKEAAAKDELVVGQADSLLILSSSTKVAEKIVTHLTGGALPALADSASYQADHQALFRDSPVYGWINAKAFLDVLARSVDSKDPEAGDPLAGIKIDKIFAASGLGALKSVAFNTQSSPEGSMVRLFLGVPETSRQGIFKILAGEPRECNPPPFVPAEAVKFQRWRLDGQKAWATLEKMLNDISPQSMNGLNFLLDTANTAAKEKDPDFDIRKGLIGNLGNDIITYEKAPRSSSDSKSTPSMVLIGSPRAEQLAGAFKSIFAFLGAQAGAPTEREFLGRKIFSVPMPALPINLGDSSKTGPRTLNYTASGGYVAFSTEPSIIEEYLRSTDTQGKALRETPGLAEAAARVSGPGTTLLGYDNQAETMRATFELLKKLPAPDSGGALNVLPGAAQISNAQKGVREWMDFSLLPPFEKVSKYFHFSVYAGSATANGLMLTMFAPVPPGLLGAPAPTTAPAK